MKKFVPLTLMLSLCVMLAGAHPGDDTIAPVVRNISIISYNVKFLPRGAVFLKHHPVKRAKLIPEKLIEENADVIVLQEAFDHVAMHIMIKKLKEVYPYTAGLKNRKVITFKRAGGVIMLSKYPLEELESIKYSQCKGIDCAANKGALLVEVTHPAGKFQVFGTHMQAGGGDEIKLSQDPSRGIIEKTRKGRIPQFAAGDFNTKKIDAKLYPKLLEALNAEDGDIDSDLKFTSDHLLNDMDSYNPERRNLIDYVFVKHNGVKIKEAKRLVKEMEKQWDDKHKDLSDHNPVILKITL